MDTPADRVRRSGYRLALALASPALLGIYAAFPALAFVPYIAIVPWALLYGGTRGPRVPAGWYVLGAWVTWMAIQPQAFRFAWYAGPVMAAAFFVAWLPFPFLYRPIHERWDLPRSVSLPLVWVTVEWCRATFGLAHFDLYALGYSQARFIPLVQAADLVGVYGLSFFVASVNGWIVDTLVAWRNRRRDGGPWPRRVPVGLVVLVVVAAGLWGYGTYRLSRGTAVEEGPRVAVIQPNHRHTAANAIGVHLTQVGLTDRLVEPGSADLIVWPENAILDNLRREGVYLRDLAWLARTKGAPLLVGAMGRSETHPGRTTNTAALVDASGTILGEYRKQMLFPWSEYVPLDDVLERFAPTVWRVHRSLARRAWKSLATGEKGDHMSLLPVPWKGTTLPVAALICVENAYPPIPAEAARLGARLFVNITSEGEVSGAVQEQLLRISIIRALETRIPYVRCGNTGISAFIDADGRVRSVLRGESGRTISDQGALLDRVPLARAGETVYVRSRDAFVLACVGLSLLLALAPRRSRVAAAALLAFLTTASGCGLPTAVVGDAASAPAAFARGQEMLGRGRVRPAAAELAAACADEATCASALHDAFVAFGGAQEPEAAAMFFADVARRYPKLYAQATGYQGHFRERAGRWRDAEALYVASVAREPSGDVLAWLGSLRLRQQRFDDAISDFRRAVELSPRDVQSRYLLGRALWLRGDRDEARRIIEAVLSDQREHGGAWAVLGRLKLEAGDPAGADLAFRTAILVDPENVEARFQLARAAIQSGRRDEFERWRLEILAVEASKARGGREG